MTAEAMPATIRGFGRGEEESSSRTPIAIRIIRALAIVVLAAYALELELELGGEAVEILFADWVFIGLILAAAALALGAGVHRRGERAAWAMIGLALMAWAAGELHFILFLADLDPTPVPTFADASSLAFYLLAGVGIVLLMRARLSGLSAALALDALIAGLAMASLGVLFFEPVLALTEGEASSLAIAVNLAYPLADLVLLGLVGVMLTFAGWRPSPSWLLLTAGLAGAAVADSLFLYLSVTDGYAEGGMLDAAWPASLLLIGMAAWAPSGLCGTVDPEDVRVPIVTAASAALALCLTVYVATGGAPPLAAVLPAGTMATVIARMAGALRQNRRLLVTTRRQATTDALTGLGNRRRLVEDLEIELRRATVARPTVLALFDLDGFKAYNDAFGHPAGDALLVRLGEKLSGSLADVGAGYRMGGDEFCVLVRASGAEADDAISAAGDALSDRGVGFEVAPSCGTVTLPREAGHPAMALQIADRRMYDDKAGRRGNGVASAVEQTRDVLMRIRSERQPDLGSHVDDVARLATATARRLGLADEAVAEVGQAAQLHDIGKIAVPDALLDKRGPLDEAEWRFMRQHTVLGEHILEAAPSLAGVARLVRSSHESWDGCGYPDGLAGEEIPLGARIIAACDAYDAMTTDRSYRGALTFDAATREMRLGAETQFDPEVVAALLEELEESHQQPALAVAG